MSQAKIFANEDQLQVVGELDFSSVMSLWNESLPILSKYSQVCFDFSRVTSINSAGLALLIEWKKYASQTNRLMTFINLPSQLRTLAALCGLHNL